MTGVLTAEVLTGETVELLQTDDPQPLRQRRHRRVGPRDAQRRRCCGRSSARPASTSQRFEPTPGAASLVARIEGTDPAAPSLCLMGHTDVVPVNESGWSRDPFGGELVDGEVWGRGAVDMLNLTASMAVAFRHLADTGFRPEGDLIYFAVADEESGSAHGMQWMADHERDAIRADYVLTESGGLHSGPRRQPYISVNVGEKGVAWRRLRVHGTPGHGSTPFRADNALIKAAAVMQRLPTYRPGAAVPRAVDASGSTRWPSTTRPSATLLDAARIDDLLDSMPRRRRRPPPRLHAHDVLVQHDRRRGGR